MIAAGIGYPARKQKDKPSYYSSLIGKIYMPENFKRLKDTKPVLGFIFWNASMLWQ